MMNWRTMRRAVFLSMILCASASAQSHRGPRPDATTQSAPPTTAPIDDSKLSITQHEMTLDGSPLKYRATAGSLAMKDESGKPKANIFFVAYDTQAGDPTARPITFLFDGAPGTAAVWLHRGGAGPKCVDDMTCFPR